MRPTLRLAAAAVTLVAAAALPVSVAAAAGECTPIENRSAFGHTAGHNRASTEIITVPSADVPKATVDGATVASKISLTNTGIVRAVKVKNISIAHTNLSDLALRLRTPDGSLVLLANALAGANMTSTTFSDAAPSIFVGLPPYFGTFAPQEWLAQLYGEPIAGDWQLEITDAAGTVTGSLTAWTIEITPESCEEQPLASFTATPNPVSPGGTVTFDAASSTGASNATIVHYEWDLDGDGTFETDTGSTPTTSIAYAVKGTYAVAVRVTDAGGFSDQTTLAVAVTATPVPAMTVTPSSPLSLVNVTLDASASFDSDGTIVRYEWDLDGNGSYEVDAGNISAIQRLFGTSGPRTVGLQVTDDSGATAVTSVLVNVENRPPIADFQPVATPAIVGTPATLSAGPSYDLDGTIADHEWDLDDDGTYETNTGGSPTVDHIFPASGTYTVGLRVTDNRGDSATVSKDVVATQAPVAVVGATPLVTRPGVPVTFDPAGSSDPDPTGSIVSYGWDFDGDGTVDQASATGGTVVHSYSAFGQYTARVTVTDDEGAATSATVVVNVQNDPPTAALSISPATVLTGVPVTLSAEGSLDPDGPIAEYEWDLDGNGTFETNSGTTATIVRSFPNRMRVTVKVRVSDGDGATATASGALAVDLATTPPGPGGGQPGGGDAGGGGGSGGSGGSGGPGGGPGGSPGTAFTASLSGSSIQDLRRAVRRGIGVTCKVDRGATCVLELVVSGRDARRLRLAKGKRASKPVRIARGRASTASSGSKAVTLKLTPRARRALKRSRKRIVVVVQGTATDTTGATATLKRAVMLR